jgi:hypothetical protein
MGASSVHLGKFTNIRPSVVTVTPVTWCLKVATSVTRPADKACPAASTAPPANTPASTTEAVSIERDLDISTLFESTGNSVVLLVDASQQFFTNRDRRAYPRCAPRYQR